jgi:riboflavin synthase
MFTGIVQGRARVGEIADRNGVRRLWLSFPDGATEGLGIGASVAVDGVCLTAVEIDGQRVRFDAIDETLQRSTLGDLAVGQAVNFERAARFSDEIGGHLISGHVFCRSVVSARESTGDNVRMAFRLPPEAVPYVFEKGFIGVDGISLTVGLVDLETSTFSVHLIPETLSVTTLGDKGVGGTVNIELDAMTQAVVATVERVLRQRGLAG